MRFWRQIVAVAAACMLAASGASARPNVTEKTEYYTIRGDTGWELYRDMNRRGPRHGFMTKAIAQTRYTSTPHGKMVHRDGICRMSGGGFSLAITYIYPKPRARLSADLAHRWRAFMADNVRHEKRHGAIAREMATTLDHKMRSFAMRDRPNCRRATARLKRDLDTIYRQYAAAQRAFDEREHRKGGPVDRSVAALIGKK